MTPVALVATFPCAACQHAYPVSLQHDSGYCIPCVQKNHSFWLKRFDLRELVEIAHMIWDDVPKLEELAA